MSPHRCRVKLVGRACEHDLCVTLQRGVPPDLRCEDSAPRGYGPGGGSSCGCRTPEGFDELIARELRDNLQESRRRGFVLIRAA
jgi:hypothetical protein